MPSPKARVLHLVNKLDFERLLAARARSRSAHFAVHHVSASPLQPIRVEKRAGVVKLSTGYKSELASVVDNHPSAVWLGCMVPKRQARRAATRNLIKRQMRSAAARHRASMAAGIWLLRLRAPFAASQFSSAQSAALAAATRAELDELLSGACGPVGQLVVATRHA